MKNINSRQNSSAKKFWDNYINFLFKEGVKEKICRWYVIRAEQYIKSLPDKLLANHKHDDVAASIQNQILNALVFFFDNVLKKSVGNIGSFARAKRPKRLPVVLSKSEVGRLLNKLKGHHWLMASLMYGTGMRLMDCVRLRVADIDFEYMQIIVRNSKGKKDRVVPLPDGLSGHLQNHLKKVKGTHQNDLKNGQGDVYLPNALGRKYKNAEKEWIWQYVFPSGRLSVDPPHK
jgi:integrase